MRIASIQGVEVHPRLTVLAGAPPAAEAIAAALRGEGGPDAPAIVVDHDGRSRRLDGPGARELGWSGPAGPTAIVARDILGRPTTTPVATRASAGAPVERTPVPAARDTARVEAALESVQRVQEGPPPRTGTSTAASDLADAWAEAQRRLSELPAPPSPPEWLVTPAMTALHEAREAFVQAEALGSAEGALDPKLVKRLEAAHAEVLDAEQRAMRRGGRQQRKRADDAHKRERAALDGIGVASYGEYLERVAASHGRGREDRISRARSAVADAEAVWEELHGGNVPHEWTSAREVQITTRAHAHALLGAEVPDAELEKALRSHREREPVSDGAAATDALRSALADEGADLAGVADADLMALARRWLDEAASPSPEAEPEPVAPPMVEPPRLAPALAAAYVAARAAALRGAPLVIEAAVARVAKSAVERAAKKLQVVVVGDDGLAEWVASLGERGAVQQF